MTETTETTEQFALPEWCEALRDKDPEQMIREEGGTRERFLQGLLFSALQQRMAAAAEKSAAEAALRVVEDSTKALARQEKKTRAAVTELDSRIAQFAQQSAEAAGALAAGQEPVLSPGSPLP